MRTRIVLAIGLFTLLLAPLAHAAGRITDASAVRAVKKELGGKAKWKVTLEGRKTARTRGFTAVSAKSQRVGAVDMMKGLSDRVTIFRTARPAQAPVRGGTYIGDTSSGGYSRTIGGGGGSSSGGYSNGGGSGSGS